MRFIPPDCTCLPALLGEGAAGNCSSSLELPPSEQNKRVVTSQLSEAGAQIDKCLCICMTRFTTHK